MRPGFFVIAGASLLLLAWRSPDWLPPSPWWENPTVPPDEQEHARQVIASDGDDQCYLVAFVNGVGVKFLLDTGSSSVALSPSDGRRVLGVNFSKLRYDEKISTANGIGRAASITLHELRIGDQFRLRDLAAHVDEKLDASLLGAAVLKLLNLQFSKGFCTVTLPKQSASAAAAVSKRRG